MRDEIPGIENERHVRLAAYCALGLSAINLTIFMILAMMLLKGTV